MWAISFKTKQTTKELTIYGILCLRFQLQRLKGEGMLWVWGQPELHSNILFQNKIRKRANKGMYTGKTVWRDRRRGHPGDAVGTHSFYPNCFSILVMDTITKSNFLLLSFGEERVCFSLQIKVHHQEMPRPELKTGAWTSSQRAILLTGLIPGLWLDTVLIQPRPTFPGKGNAHSGQNPPL